MAGRVKPIEALRIDCVKERVRVMVDLIDTGIRSTQPMYTYETESQAVEHSLHNEHSRTCEVKCRFRRQCHRMLAPERAVSQVNRESSEASHGMGTAMRDLPASGNYDGEPNSGARSG